MNIHLITTGHVKITENWRVGKGEGLLRLANTLFDSRFTDWLPIYCAVIEHPEGLIVIDTGISADANAPIYFPPHLRLVQRASPFSITLEEEIGAQMRTRGLNPMDVRWVILTHLHRDHDGGLHHFPNAGFIVARDEWAAAQGWRGRMGGYSNQLWPASFAPRLIDFSGGSYHSFTASEQVTRAGDVRLLPTPGHSAGHLSVALEQDDHVVLFAGDAAYSQELLLANTLDGIAPNPKAHRQSQRNLLSLAAAVPTVLLTSHDPDTAGRLENRSTIPVMLAHQAMA